MAVYSYPAPQAPSYKKPTSVEDCLPNARISAKKQRGRTALGPVKRGDKILIVSYPDLDKYVKEAVTQALEEEGAERVDFVYEHELTGKKPERLSVEDGWKEADIMAKAVKGTAGRPFAEELAGGVRKYLNEHPDYTGLFCGLGGRVSTRFAMREHGSKYRNCWIFNNWEEFASKAWACPDEISKEIERPAIEAIGKASKVRITDPEGTFLEYPLTEEEALRWQMCAWQSGHLYLDPLQATAQEASVVPVSPKVPPVFHDLNGVLAGTANHSGFFPRIELYFEHDRLVEAKGGGRYGDIIRELMDKYRDVHFPHYPNKGFFWFCDAALCTIIKSFRRTSDMFSSYWEYPNLSERNRAGVFHHGFGSRRHFGEEYDNYVKEHNVPHGHLHVHNYFTTYEVKLRGTEDWLKINDKGRLGSLDDPKIRTLAVKYGDPNELLSYDWQPPLPGINCEGDYFKDYAPDPMAYLKKRMKEGKPI